MTGFNKTLAELWKENGEKPFLGEKELAEGHARIFATGGVDGQSFIVEFVRVRLPLPRGGSPHSQSLRDGRRTGHEPGESWAKADPGGRCQGGRGEMTEGAAQKFENMMALVKRLDALSFERNPLPVDFETWGRISRALRLAVASTDSLFQAIEHGDKEHRKWLWQKLDEHFAEFRRALEGSPE